MSDSKSFCYIGTQNISCLALNNETNKVMIAYANELELLQIGEDKFCLRNIYNFANRTLRIMDIAWSSLNENLIACGGSNGEIHRIVVTPTELRLDGSSPYHNRTITKIAFHPNDAYKLLSGGHDALVQLIDIRSPNDGMGTYSFKHEQEDRVTDVQFNPSADMSNCFASGTQNGAVYEFKIKIWDIRNPSRYEKRIKCHIGQVNLDWHLEEKHWLATGSIDKKIHVWNLEKIIPEKPTTMHTLTHSETVSSIRWRPKRKTQITACSTAVDAHLYVWDFKRPYVPYASFDSLTNKVKNFAWRNNPKTLIASTMKNLYHMTMSDAVRPAESSSLVAVQIDKFGSVAFAVGVEAEANTSDVIADHLLAEHDTKSVSSDANLEKLRITKSVLYFDTHIPSVRCDWLQYSAKHYKFKSSTYEQMGDNKDLRNHAFEELCDHNAQVAFDYKKFDIYKNWKILKTIYKDSYKLNPNAGGVSDEDEVKTLASPRLLSNANKFFNEDSDMHMQMPFSTNLQNNINLNMSSSSSDLSIQTSSSSSEFISDDSNNLMTNVSLLATNLNDSNLPSKNYTSEKFNIYASNELNIMNDFGLTSAEGNTKGASNNTSQKRLISSHGLDKNTNANIGLMNISQAAMGNGGGAASNRHTNEATTGGHQRTQQGFSHLTNRFDEEDDYLLAPSDIIEYNREEDLGTLFNFGGDKSSNSNGLGVMTSGQQHGNFNQMSSLGQKNGHQQSPDFNWLLAKSTKVGAGGHKQLNRMMNTSLGENNAVNSSADDQSFQIMASTVPGMTKESSKSQADGNVNGQSDKANEKFGDFNLFLSNPLVSSSITNMDFDDYVYQLLLHYVNEENDLTTTVFMFLVTHLHGKFDKSKVENHCLDEWFGQYIELLAKFDLWNHRVEILKAYQSDFLNMLTQKSLTYNVMCANCKKTIQKNTYVCIGCKKNVFLCAYCHLPVKRLYAWCHKCCHGGHMNHMIKWFEKNSKCPSGCGCSCVHT